MKIFLLTFSVLVIKVFTDDCGGEKYKVLGNGVIMRCRKGVWRVSKRSQPKGPPCSDDPSLAANGTCSADRGHCQQYTVAGADMDRDCPETCESCDACRCQDASQWHSYCPLWFQYCGSSGVLGTWMTSNCRKTCGKCKCKCCSYAGKQHKLGGRIPLPEKCGELICEEGLVADYSPLLKGAADHKVSHPEELTLNFRSVHNGADCCILPGNATNSNGSSFANGTMVQEGWSGDLATGNGVIPTICCHGVLSVPLGAPSPTAIVEVSIRTGDRDWADSEAQAELEVCDDLNSCCKSTGGLDNANLMRMKGEIDSYSSPEHLGSCFEKSTTGNLRIKIGTYGRNLEDAWFIDWVIIKTPSEDFKCTVGGFVDNGPNAGGPSSRSTTCSKMP